VSIETRFADGADGTVPYRVDGGGEHDVLLVSDWGAPYGEPGAGAFGRFAGAMGEHGSRLVTMLDGTVGARAAEPETAQRIAAARAVADHAGLQAATLLGVADGAPVAAALAAAGAPFAERLVLFDTFPLEDRDLWGLERDEAAGRLTTMTNAEQVRRQVKSADEALDWVRGMWRTVRAEVEADPELREKVRIPEEAQRAIQPFLGGEQRWSGGIADLLEKISQLEGTTRGDAVSALSAVALPTLVLDAGGAGADGTSVESLGLEVAARIPGSRHRTVAKSGRWPWAAPELTRDLFPGGRPALPSPAPVSHAPERVLATVLFTDIVGSTERLAAMGDAAWRDLLDRHNRTVRAQLDRSGGREIDNAGDGFLAAFEVPVQGVRCAMAIRDAVGELGLAVRAGLHTGECERIGSNLVGIAVHVGARIAAQAGAGQILVSAIVRDLTAGSGIGFVEHGVTSLKGVPGDWRLYEVAAPSD
jgi:class 3 adenylate cyclase